MNKTRPTVPAAFAALVIPLAGMVSALPDTSPGGGGEVPVALPEVQLVVFADGAQVAPATVVLLPNVGDPDGWVTRVDFFANNEPVGTVEGDSRSMGPMNPFRFVWENVPVGEYRVQALAEDLVGDLVRSEIVPVIVALPPGERLLLPAGSVWHFWNQEGPPPGDWQVNADDLEMPEWPAGPAQLGYGDGDEATLTRDGGPPYPMTAYFRRRLDAPADLGAAALRLKLVRDDAAAVYLNGIELLRDNLPPGELTFGTPATQAAGGDDENAWHTFEVAPHALRAGPNWIAVEVHQNSPASSDLSFDLELVALLDAPPPVKPLVSIRATVPETTEPSPEVRVQPGRFVISRTGSVDEPLAVVCEFGGTAAVGQDYLLEPTPESPFSTFTIPAGQETLEVLVGALDDLDSEGVETVVAELGPFPLPAGGVPGLAEEGAGPALEQPYVIDPDQARATVVIHDNDSPSVAELVILHPPPGVVWPAGETLPIDIVATDPDGYIARVEVFDRETRVGVSEINFFVAPPPGTRIDHHVEWENPPPGEHVLRAVAVDSAGGRVVSEPVPFLVEPAFEQVVLTVTAPHPATAEPGPLVDPAPAAFVIERIAGPLDVKVPVYFQLGGTATGGKDYFELPRDLALEAGQSRLEIPVIAMPDEWAEGPESVVFELVPPECPAIYPPPPACYRVGQPGRAEIVIHDSTEPGNLPPRVMIARPRNGAVLPPGEPVRLRIQGGVGQLVVVECSNDLRHWREIAPVGLVEGALEFEDVPEDGIAVRFYRARPIGP